MVFVCVCEPTPGQHEVERWNVSTNRELGRSCTFLALVRRLLHGVTIWDNLGLSLSFHWSPFGLTLHVYIHATR